MASWSCANRAAISRRQFLLGAGVGAGAAIPAAWFGAKWFGAFDPTRPSPFTGRSTEVPRPEYRMPGPFPGRVIEVSHPDSVAADSQIKHDAVKSMIDHGMRELTGADHVAEAWRRFFEPGDVVGIKVNPVGRKYRPDQADAISSPEVLLEVVEGLKSAGVKARDIIVFERYAEQFCQAGYDALLRVRSMDGVRWYSSSVEYNNSQLDIKGLDVRGSQDAHVVGYDPDIFVHMGYAAKEHDPHDDRRFRSHLSVVVSRMVNKIVTIPVLKDHASAGVTLTLKNLSHGLNNNVARSHLAGYHRGSAKSGPNQCNTFIPTAAGQTLIRQKATLHILDGLIAVYQGGPSNGKNWPYKSLFFGTDPVALDHVGWDIIDRKRIEEGMSPVAKMGIFSTDTKESNNEAFDRRQPEHIILASTIGLGIFDARQIDHRRLAWDENRSRWSQPS
jgi:uncharacterized protein (DUF362 family)